MAFVYNVTFPDYNEGLKQSLEGFLDDLRKAQGVCSNHQHRTTLMPFQILLQCLTFMSFPLRAPRSLALMERVSLHLQCPSLIKAVIIMHEGSDVKISHLIYRCHFWGAVRIWLPISSVFYLHLTADVQKLHLDAWCCFWTSWQELSFLSCSAEMSSLGTSVCFVIL